MKTLPSFILMQNVIQNYAWGSTTAFQSLFDIPNPEGRPQAEIWMGTHQNGCSELFIGEKTVRLDDFISKNKNAVLGQRTQQAFDGLPYLFKVLSAGKALSIQVHPNKEAAQIGFAKENQLGIDVKAGNRNYKDANHKPELIYALTPFQAMNGFRHYDEIITLFEAVNAKALSPHLDDLKTNKNKQALSRFFEATLLLSGEEKVSSLNALMTYAQKNKGQALADLLIELALQYPNDVGLFAPLMLNCVTLNVGEAMFLDACTPHAYIKGTGLEIMANSDNVLRAGLTPKHIDVAELIENTVCEPKTEGNILLAPVSVDNAKHYPIPVNDFKFSIYQNDAHICCDSAEIIFALDSDVKLVSSNQGETLVLSKGQSAFIPCQTQTYRVYSEGNYARAYN